MVLNLSARSSSFFMWVRSMLPSMCYGLIALDMVKSGSWLSIILGVHMPEISGWNSSLNLPGMLFRNWVGVWTRFSFILVIDGPRERFGRPLFRNLRL